MSSLVFAFLVVAFVAAATLLCLNSPSGQLAEYADHVVRDDPGPVGDSQVKVTSLGTTTLLVDDGKTKILIDAFLTPTGPLSAILRRKVQTDKRAVDEALAGVMAKRVRAIYVSHAHHDHAFDLAYVAESTGAKVYGSESTLNVARGGNVSKELLLGLPFGEPVTEGTFTVRALNSRHSPNPIGGEGATIPEPLPQPARVLDYKEGGTVDFLVTTPQIRMLFKNSPNWAPGALKGVAADVLFLAVGGLGRALPSFVDAYFDETIGVTGPRLVVATHWNDFFQVVKSPLPMQRRFVDDTPHALDRLLARARKVGCDVALLDAYAGVLLQPQDREST